MMFTLLGEIISKEEGEGEGEEEAEEEGQENEH